MIDEEREKSSACVPVAQVASKKTKVEQTRQPGSKGAITKMRLFEVEAVLWRDAIRKRGRW
jgi:hypothetical protein